MSDRNDKCEARIGDAMEGREEDVARLLAAQSGDTICVHCTAVIEESVDPGDESEVWVDETGGDACPEREDGGAHEPDTDTSEDSIYEFGIGISTKVVIRYELSTGGPGDWLEIEVDPENRFRYMGATYHYNDWFDHAERPVPDGSALDRFCGWVAETHADGLFSR